MVSVGAGLAAGIGRVGQRSLVSHINYEASELALGLGGKRVGVEMILYMDRLTRILMPQKERERKCLTERYCRLD